MKPVTRPASWIGTFGDAKLVAPHPKGGTVP
jgi:hypothetical protein